jgi:hypothetical protein
VGRDGDQGGSSDELLLIEPAVYFRALCGVEVPAGGGMVKCPLPDHDDAYASCQVFAEAERGWWCFGCARGGRIYDLASLLPRPRPGLEATTRTRRVADVNGLPRKSLQDISSLPKSFPARNGTPAR